MKIWKNYIHFIYIYSVCIYVYRGVHWPSAISIIFSSIFFSFLLHYSFFSSLSFTSPTSMMLKGLNYFDISSIPKEFLGVFCWVLSSSICLFSVVFKGCLQTFTLKLFHFQGSSSHLRLLYIITDTLFCWLKILQTCLLFQKPFVFLLKTEFSWLRNNQVVILHNPNPCISKQRPCMSCFIWSASRVLQVPKICKNVQNIWWKEFLVPWSNSTNNLSLLSPLFYPLSPL